MSQFYRQFARPLALMLILLLPFLTRQADSIGSNNDIETWLPQETQAGLDYEFFKDLFGAEEAIIVGLPEAIADPLLTEAVATRIENLSSIRACWTPDRFMKVMKELGVNSDQIDSRLTGLVLSKDHATQGLVALLTPQGLANREQTVQDVKDILNYSQLSAQETFLSGAPVIVAELNQLGSQENSKTFFVLTLIICFSLLIFSTRHWRLSSSILIITLIAIQTTLASVKWLGGEMNFILSALPVMVMVFTMATSIHFVHYYTNSSNKSDQLAAALSTAWKPCLLATFTTAIGLVSLVVSDITPVRQFGLAAALGAIISCLCGLGLTPIALTLWPDVSIKSIIHSGGRSSQFALHIVHRKKAITAFALTLLFVTGMGLRQLTSKVDPLDFLPRNSDVIADYLEIENSLTNIDSIEAVVDFGIDDASFTEKLQKVQQLESILAEHPNVNHTMSLATFFPDPLPESGLEVIQLLSKARSSEHGSDYVSMGERYWRISARIYGESTDAREQVFADLREQLKEEPILLTGIAPLVKQAQDDIFAGFWESFATALFIIAFVMIFALRSVKTALIAMIPNLAPLCVVFGTLGWLRFPVDIGMMMTASIALGIAVDGTFHFLVAYQKECKKCQRRDRNALVALFRTGTPIFEAAAIASAGMLALTQSMFIPTVRFGLLMSILLVAALMADLVLLPALLSIQGKSKIKQKSREIPDSENAEPQNSRIAA